MNLLEKRLFNALVEEEYNSGISRIRGQIKERCYYWYIKTMIRKYYPNAGYSKTMNVR